MSSGLSPIGPPKRTLKRYAEVLHVKCLAFLFLFCRTSSAANIDSPVLEAAKHHQRLTVLLMLTDQPYAEVTAEPLQRELFESRLRRAADNEAAVEQASSDLDAFTLESARALTGRAKVRIDTQQRALEGSLKALGGSNILRYQFLNLMRAEIPATALPVLAADPRVASIGLVERGEAQIGVSVRSLGSPAFWNGTPQITGTGQSIALLDSGIAAHPALQSTITSSRFLTPGAINCTNPDDYMTNADLSGHGTHVAGILASADTPAFAGNLGVAFRLSNLYNIKVACRTANSLTPVLLVLYSDDDLLLGLQHAVTNTPAKVINLSLGKRDSLEDSTFNRAIDAAIEIYGVNVIVSAGNYGSLNVTLTSPGTAYNGLTVGAFNTQGTEDRADDLPAGFSSRGPTQGGRRKPDIMAPGGLRDSFVSGRPEFPCSDGFAGSCGIYSTSNSSAGYVPLPGTSMAAAHISGAAALMRQAGVTNALAVKALLINTTDTEGWSPSVGWGYANLFRLRGQLENYLLSGVSAGGYNFYRATANSALAATLAWNRHVGPTGTASLTDLDLAAYKGLDGTKLGASESKLDNVEKINLTAGGGTIILKVRNLATSPGTEQPYALATSVRGFALIAGPVLSVSCETPFVAAGGSSVAILCSARNSGDLDASDVRGTLTFQNVVTPLTFGKIAPGARVTRSWTITAPAAAAAYTARVDLTSTTLEEVFGATAAVNFFSSACTYSISADVASFAAQGGSGQLNVVTQAGCPTVVQTAAPWITITPPSRFSVAANTGGPRTGSIFASGETIQIAQRAPSPSSVFDDVPASTAFSDYINLLRQNNVTSGCSASNYCPDDNTTRGQMAIFIVRSLLGTDDFMFPLVPFFQDVRETHPQFKYIQKLRDLGITSGCTNIEFCPDLLISRGQMAVFIVRGRLGLIAGQAFPHRTAPYFNDVPPTHPFFSFIQKMRELGITSGCSAGSYCPDGWTTRGQMAVFLIRALFTP